MQVSALKIGAVAIFFAGAMFLTGAATAAPITCSQIPKAQAFVDKLRPGPNTRAAQRHLDAAKAAASNRQCVAELRQVDIYARRSAAADRRAGHPVRLGHRHGHHHPRCADALHQDRPGGTDYHGPRVPGCH